MSISVYDRWENSLSPGKGGEGRQGMDGEEDENGDFSPYFSLKFKFLHVLS